MTTTIVPLLSRFTSHHLTGNSHQQDLLTHDSERMDQIRSEIICMEEGNFWQILAFDSGRGYTPEKYAMKRDQSIFAIPWV